MKNVLIPTTFGNDTEHALKIAAGMFDGEKLDIVLLSLTAISDSITELLFLGADEKIDLQKRENVITSWNQFKSKNGIPKELKLHHQYGISRPVLKNILFRYNIGLAILPLSFQQSKSHIHQLTLRLLQQCETPVMLLPDKVSPEKYLKRALYLDHGNHVDSEVIHRYPFHVIRHSTLVQAQDNPISSIVESMKIDLIVRKKQAAIADINELRVDDLNLPVLNV